MHCLAGKGLAQRPPPAPVAADHCRLLRPDRQKRVSDIDTGDILAVLQPLWQSRHVTAGRLRGRIEKILAYSKARGWRSGENPAVWRNHLDSLLPKRQRLTRGHLRAMPYDKVGGFLATVRGIETISARALELILLTAVRRNEGLGARWSEIDLDKALWTIPKERTKSGKGHMCRLRQALSFSGTSRYQALCLSSFPVAPLSRPLTGRRPPQPSGAAGIQVDLSWFSQQFQGLLRGSYELSEEVAELALGHRWRRNRAGLPQELRTTEARRFDAGMGRLSRWRGGQGYSVAKSESDQGGAALNIHPRNCAAPLPDDDR